MNPAELAPYLVGVFVVALLYGSVGHGGASGYIAVLSLSAMTAQQVGSTALALNLFVSGLAWFAFFRAGSFRWDLTWPFIVASVPCSFIGARIEIEQKRYFLALGFILFYAALQLLIKPGDGKIHAYRSLFACLLAGSVIGLVSGAIGVGGGIFLSPLIVLLGWGGAKEAAATSALFIFVNSVAGIGGRLMEGRFAPQHLLPFVLAAAFGGLIGSIFAAKKFSPLVVRRALGLVLLVAAVKQMMEFSF